MFGTRRRIIVTPRLEPSPHREISYG